MIGLIQRVRCAEVRVDDVRIAHIGPGLLALVGIEREDDTEAAERLLERMLGYRVFADANGKMNLSLRDTGGSLLLVSQFTLAADTRKGTRASFSSAAAPEPAQALFERLVGLAREAHSKVECGRFGADMQVSLTNDGPVTFWLQA